MTKEEKQIILRAVKSSPHKTYEEIANELNISKRTLITAIAGLYYRPRGRKLNLKKAS